MRDGEILQHGDRRRAKKFDCATGSRQFLLLQDSSNGFKSAAEPLLAWARARVPVVRRGLRLLAQGGPRSGSAAGRRTRASFALISSPCLETGTLTRSPRAISSYSNEGHGAG